MKLEELTPCDVGGKTDKCQVIASRVGPVSCAYCKKYRGKSAEVFGLVAIYFSLNPPEENNEFIDKVTTFIDGQYLTLRAAEKKYGQRMADLAEGWYEA